MITRKKRLRLIQLSFLIVGALIIYFTYSGTDKPQSERILPEETRKKVIDQLSSENRESKQADIFYNIEYSGLDLAGNRYILKSAKASTDKTKQEIVKMEIVEAVFYFKDNTILYIWSDTGVYNNKTLDMNFYKNIKAQYQESELFAQKATYSNSESFLKISDKVRINDINGTMFADKLLFDIKKQTLNIASFNDGKINANIKLK